MIATLVCVRVRQTLQTLDHGAYQILLYMITLTFSEMGMFLFPSFSSAGRCGGRLIAFQKRQTVNSGQLMRLLLNKNLLISISEARSGTLPLVILLSSSSLLKNNNFFFFLFKR